MKLYRAYIDLDYKVQVIKSEAKETPKGYKIIGLGQLGWYGQLVKKDNMGSISLTPEEAILKLFAITKNRLASNERNVEVNKEQLKAIEAYIGSSVEDPIE